MKRQHRRGVLEVLEQRSLLSSNILKFDFGTPTSPTAPGYASVSEATNYTSTQGYGWLAGTSKPYSRDRGVGSDLNRDLVVSSTRLVFGVDLPDGVYDVTLTMGDAGYPRSGEQVWLEGSQVDTIATAQGQFAQRTYQVVVTGGQLTVDLRAAASEVVVNGLEIASTPKGPIVTSGSVQSGWAGYSAAYVLGSFVQYNSAQTGPWTVDVDWGDGSAHTVFTQKAAGSLPLVPHAYAKPGGYKPLVKVTDARGLSGTSTFDINVTGLSSSMKFDFGTPTSPVAPGYTAVNETTKYSLAQGFGWLTGTGNPFSRDRGVGSDLTRDLNSSSTRLVFGVDLPDATYSVTLTMGDAGFDHAGVQVWLEGSQVDTVSTAAGQFAQRTYQVVVTGGQLTVDLRAAANGAVINGLAVGPAIQPPQVSPAASQSDWAGRSATFNVGSFSQSSAAQVPLGPWTVDIDWGDGSAHTVFTQTTVGSLPQVPHAYATPGNYKPIVTVTDSIGMSGAANFDVLIQAIVQPGVAGPKFDFGTTASPVAPGYTAVDETTKYTLAQGFGWLAGTGSPYSRDRGVGSDLNRDLAASASRLVFGVDLPDGPYVVTLTMGDASFPHAGMQVWLEGSQVDTISTAQGQYTQRTYQVMVTGGQLTVDVRASVNDVVINGLMINPVPTPPVVTPAAGQFDWAGRLTTFSIGSFSEFYSDKAQLGPWTVDVDWGDGSAHTVFTQTTVGVLPLVPHLYGTAGAYKPVVRVTDASGRSGTASFKVDVAASAPGQVATSYVLQPPSDRTGDIDTHSDNFNLILGPGALAGAARVTLTTSNGDGTFSSSVIDLTASASLANFTYKPTKIGQRTVLATNAAGLVNPSGVPYTAKVKLGANADLGDLQLFPPDNDWNQDISKAPVLPQSADMIARRGAGKGLMTDWGVDYPVGSGSPWGIPYIVVDNTQPMVKITVKNPYKTSDLDPGDPNHITIPIPPDTPIEHVKDNTMPMTTVSDRHAIIYNRDTGMLYELFHAVRDAATGAWSADAVAVWDTKTNEGRPDGLASADAAGLPILPGLIRYDEAATGEIDHALRMTVGGLQGLVAKYHIAPARSQSGGDSSPLAIPFGTRIRLSASYDISGPNFPGTNIPLSPLNRAILKALQTYGAIIADGGPDWDLLGAPDARWDVSDVMRLRNVPSTALEILDLNFGPGYTVTPPPASTGTVGVPSTWTVTLNAPFRNVDMWVYPRDDQGVWGDPYHVKLTTASPTGTFTYTPTVAGVRTIAFLNDIGRINAPSVTYTVNPAGTATNSRVSAASTGRVSMLSAQDAAAPSSSGVTASSLTTMALTIAAPAGDTVQATTADAATPSAVTAATSQGQSGAGDVNVSARKTAVPTTPAAPWAVRPIHPVFWKDDSAAVASPASPLGYFGRRRRSLAAIFPDK